MDAPLSVRSDRDEVFGCRLCVIPLDPDPARECDRRGDLESGETAMLLLENLDVGTTGRTVGAFGISRSKLGRSVSSCADCSRALVRVSAGACTVTLLIMVASPLPTSSGLSS